MRAVAKPLLALVAVTAAACSDGNPRSGEATTDTPTTRATPTSSDAGAPTSMPGEASDGVLTIGVLLPQTGEGATIGIPGTAAANLAVGEINEAGGVLGQHVHLVTQDEGQSLEQAQSAIAELLASDVDAIVGPASSLVALEHLDDLVSEGVVTCSPSATSMALDDYPDDGLFFRSVASDSLQAVAIGGQAERTGVSTASVVYVDDAFGRPFARAVIDNLRERGMQVLGDIPIAESDFAEAAERLASADATGTIIVIADSNDGWNLLSQLADRIPSPPNIIVNDAMRRPPAPEIVASLPAPFREAIAGMSPMAIIEPGVPPEGAYAPQSYNCANLIALAAAAVESDDSARIADAIRSVADAGSDCESFPICAERLAQGLDIDYNGPGSLLLQLGPTGDPSRASFQVFRFDANGVDVGAGSGNVSG